MRYAYLLLMVTSSVFATGSNHHNETSSQELDQQQEQQQTQDNDQSASALITIDESYISTYDEVAATAYTSVASWCHAAAAVQTHSMGISITTRAKVCELLEVSRVQLEIASKMKCTSPSKLDKSGTVWLPNSCMEVRDRMIRDGLVGIRAANEEASRKEGFIKRLWRKVW